jgi:HlyD family secretion protein
VAQIDPRVYEARLAQDEASLTQALASVEQADARLAQADRELGRARELARRDMQSQAELDAAQAERDILAAQAKLSRAAVEQGQAALRLSRANLEYTRIRSPVDGVVIARNVSEGQTVVASMTAQVLFTVATDLRRIQVEASVPEADIGKVRAGQPVTFTVDAHDQTFHGTVAQVRMAATTVQNVVTYTVVIDAENPEGKLFPGMTATITCEIARRADALKVPNAALRFRPPAAADGATARSGEKTGTGRLAGGGASGGVSGGAARKPGSGDRSRQAVWIQKSSDAAPERVTVGLGITDGQFTELADAAGLAEGREVLVGLAEAKAEAKTVNPFVPVFPGRNRPR